MLITLILAFLLIDAFIIYVLTRPNAFTLTRSVVVHAPVERVFALVSDFRQWAHWSPWEHMDPTMTREYGARTYGVDGSYAWEGKKVGAGKMTFTEVIPNEKITLRLEFLRPMPAVNMTTFTFAQHSEGVTVTWTMSGEHAGFMAKVFGVLAMEKVVGKSFEQGLQKMKEVSEK